MTLTRPKTLPQLSYAAALTAALSFTACGGGGGSSNVGPTNLPGNLRATAMSVVAPNPPTAAHEIEMQTSIEATRAYQDVVIAYYLVHKEDYDNEVEEPRQFEVDSAVQGVAAGTNPYTAFITIPEHVSPVADYYLISRVDPLDEIEETNGRRQPAAGRQPGGRHPRRPRQPHQPRHRPRDRRSRQ